jgi:hypothetical protein
MRHCCSESDQFGSKTQAALHGRKRAPSLSYLPELGGTGDRTRAFRSGLSRSNFKSCAGSACDYLAGSEAATRSTQYSDPWQTIPQARSGGAVSPDPRFGRRPASVAGIPGLMRVPIFAWRTLTDTGLRCCANSADPCAEFAAPRWGWEDQSETQGWIFRLMGDGTRIRGNAFPTPPALTSHWRKRSVSGARPHALSRSGAISGASSGAGS